MGDKVRDAAQALVEQMDAPSDESWVLLARARFSALRAALASPPQEQAPGWMPIETAPKDGTAVYLLEGDKVFRGSWLESKYREERDLDGRYIDHTDADEYWMDHEDGESREPTHWQPEVLPAAPSQEQAKGRL